MHRASEGEYIVCEFVMDTWIPDTWIKQFTHTHTHTHTQFFFKKGVGEDLYVHHENGNSNVLQSYAAVDQLRNSWTNMGVFGTQQEHSLFIAMVMHDQATWMCDHFKPGFLCQLWAISLKSKLCAESISHTSSNESDFELRSHV